MENISFRRILEFIGVDVPHGLFRRLTLTFSSPKFNLPSNEADTHVDIDIEAVIAKGSGTFEHVIEIAIREKE